ncbi:MAG: EscU/YscU/HrcU family type III secretion system export apparatus switch protein [Pseudomonadota bacterium]
MSERKKISKAAALAYTPGMDIPPRIVASGSGEIAERIIALAVENGIPIREDDNLANLLEALDVDMDIPPALYRAVAEVLVFVYRLNGLMVPTEGDGAGGGTLV